MSAPGSHQGGGGNKSKQNVTEIDPDGDLTLVVGKTKTRFLVCSKALSRSALVWKVCLYGQSKEAKPAAGQDWVVEFPEDNPSGLECLLLLVHGLGHKMPEVNLQLAFEITVLSNKYDMTQSLWAVARSWVENLKPVRATKKRDYTILPQLQWLLVTKELGAFVHYGEAFAELSQMVSTTADADAHILLRPYDQSNAIALTRENLKGYDAEKDLILSTAYKVKAAREKPLSEIQSVLKKDIQKLQDTIKAFDSSQGCTGASICTGKKADWRRRRLCDYAMQAIVTKMSANNDAALKPIAEIGLSVEDFRASTVCFTFRIQEEILIVSGESHRSCTPFTTPLPDLQALKSAVLLKWYSDNAAAFKRQARVSGLEKAGGDADGQNQRDAVLCSAARKRSRDELGAPKSATRRRCRGRMTFDSDSES